MTLAAGAAGPIPWLPEGRTMILDGRGEVFFRHHRHGDPSAPTVLLLHGWTTSADLQFFTAYPALAEVCSFVALDHRGHGRGSRLASSPFTLDDAADDAAALVHALGLDPVIALGYSMGGSIALHLARRHPGLVRGLVLHATALEWRATRAERLRWKTVRLAGPVMRSWAYPRAMRWALRRWAADHPSVAAHTDWIVGELGRNDVPAMVQAGWALSREDAQPWVGDLAVPCAVLVTTKDHLVSPRKQRALASALGAEVVELAADHLCPVTHPAAYAAAAAQMVSSVARRAGDRHNGSEPSFPSASSIESSR